MLLHVCSLIDDDSEADAPDWDALISTLSDVIPDSDCSLPSKPAVEGSEAEQKAVLKACETAIAVQKQRISECKQLVEDLDLGQVCLMLGSLINHALHILVLLQCRVLKLHACAACLDRHLGMHYALCSMMHAKMPP